MITEFNNNNCIVQGWLSQWSTSNNKQRDTNKFSNILSYQNKSYNNLLHSNNFSLVIHNNMSH